MEYVTHHTKLESFFVPKWTWRSVWFAGVVTLCIYLLLPYIEGVKDLPEKTISVRSVTTLDMRPPAPSINRLSRAETDIHKPPVPKPVLDVPCPQPTILDPWVPDLAVKPGMLTGDFATHFKVNSPALTQADNGGLVELYELDQPPQSIVNLHPAYPLKARAQKIEGEVVLGFVVDVDGTTRDIEILSSQPGDIFCNAAVRAVKHWRFKAGIKDGRTVATRVRQKVTFRLEEE